MTEKLRKQLIGVLKVVVSATLIYFIFTKINFSEVVLVLKRSNPLYLILAVLLVALSKVLAALRLNLYFHQIGVRITQLSNLKLYLLGMFYNLFLPGGIGGDAYKGYVIQKKYKSGTKKVVAVLVLDRLSGMLIIFIFGCALALLLEVPLVKGLDWIVGISIPLAIGTFWFLNKRFFNYTLPIFWKSVGYSALVQGMQLVCILCILAAISIDLNIVEYLFIFLVSSIVSVIPLTIGGWGSREVTFYYGAIMLGLNEDISFAISITFMSITSLISLFGIVYHFKKPNLETLP
nr:lysylphosphatidylglycerol synthase transmembrane domain-containing protein [Allomuricauda sp.]